MPQKKDALGTGRTVLRERAAGPCHRGDSPFREASSLAACCISARLLRWYDANRRDLPWRRRADDPYAQLLAEFMLQQTQVGTVLDYYERFINRFPTIQALAAAELDDVLALWSGLGYYRRARNLHAAARKIIEQYGGTVPQTVDELMSLPGIGRYTAGAIASIAYDVRAPVLDGNVVRVLMRLLAMRADSKSTTARSRLWRFAEGFLPRKRCGDFNQAMMELGATLCSPRAPNCDACPLRRCCRAHLRRLTDHIPPTARRTRALPARMVVAAVCRSVGRGSSREWLFVQRPSSGLWAGLWELPSRPVAHGESVAAARKSLEANLPVRCRLSKTPVATLTRQLTHRTITFEVFTASISHACKKAGSGQRPTCQRENEFFARPWQWVRPDRIRTLGISRACEAIVARLPNGRPACRDCRR
ncbi:MAG: A/G-specific adenine glycosylase [Phycisphaerae bacterium]